jgi:hypothetical protein
LTTPDVLGDNREAIADEKLAVVAPGATVVLGEPEWVSRARARGAGRVVVADDVGRAAAEAFLGRALDGDVEVVLPGRFDRVGDDVFAGAHNPAGIAWLVERLPRADYVVVASILADKDADAMLRLLARAGDTLVATASHSARGVAGRRACGARTPTFQPRRGRRGPRRGPRAGARAGRRKGRRSGHGLALPPRRPHRPIRARTMGKFGERLSVFAVAVVVVLTIVGLAFGAGYLVGKLLL